MEILLVILLGLSSHFWAAGAIMSSERYIPETGSRTANAVVGLVSAVLTVIFLVWLIILLK